MRDTPDVNISSGGWSQTCEVGCQMPYYIPILAPIAPLISLTNAMTADSYIKLLILYDIFMFEYQL